MNQDRAIRPIQIFGCGNLLFGDDGFGPAVIAHLVRHYPLPEDVLAVDAGTGICDFLFDILLSPSRLSAIYIVDAVTMSGRRPGELFQLSTERIPHIKACDFSLHQFPSVNLLREIEHHTHIGITVLAVQAGRIPDVVQPGLSLAVQQAVEPACAWLLERIAPSLPPVVRRAGSGLCRENDIFG